MPSIYQLKPVFQHLLRPLVHRSFEVGVTANQVTVHTALISILVGTAVGFFASHSWLFAILPIWMLLRMALNAIDGMLAREFDQQLFRGSHLFPLGTVLVDVSRGMPLLKKMEFRTD
jgi:CDP-diacylglycerol--glycerol-3-phosphate 3-phosphatidyltransferase